MSRPRRTRACAFVLMLLPAGPACAASDEAQFWSTQQAEVDLGDETELQIEAVERARSAAFGGDQYQFRAGAYRDVGKGFNLGGAVVYQRTGRQDELRLQQQLTFETGPLAFRSRLEQRFIEGNDDTVWRFRQRVQLSETLDANERWAAFGNAEGQFTLNAGNPESRAGLTGLRIQVGVRHQLSDRLSLTLAYVRAQEFRDDTPDRVGHAPLIGLSLTL